MPTIYVDHPLVRAVDLLTQPNHGDDRDILNFEYLSASQIKAFRTCGVAYYLKYAKGIVGSPEKGMIKGTGLHTGLAASFIGHMNGAPLSVDEAIELGKQAATNEIANTLLDPETSAEILRDVERGIPFMLKENAGLKPLAIERGIVIHWNDANVLPIVGYPDMLAQERAPFIIDWKGAAKSKAQIAADIDIGLTTYATGYRLIHKLASMVTELRVCVFTKELKSQLLSATRNDADTTVLFNVCRVMTEQLQRGYYMPALDPDNFLACNKCGVRKECRELITRTA